MQVSSRIEHVVVLMLENRSFDHLFGYYPGANGLKGEEYNLLNPFQPVSDSNPRFMVGDAAPWQITQGQGPGHSLNASNIQQSGSKAGPSAASPGKNNGFVMSYQEALQSDRVGNPDQQTLGIPMQAFRPGQLPALTALAQEFVLCDNWYSEVPGPTQPNRLYVHAATSQGYAHNVWQNVFDCRTIYNQLEDAGKTWAVYYSDDNDVAKFSRLTARAYTTADEAQAWAADSQAGALGAYFDYQTFFSTHAAQGTLPNYVFIEPSFGDSGLTKGAVNSMHPPSDLRPGDRLVAEVYAALRGNPDLWAKTLFVVTFDEHGGFYDHVIPPAAVNPDGRTSPPAGDESYAPSFAFDRLGLRVPTILASPWLARGQIESGQYQHTSILATVRDIFGITEGPLTQRDAHAASFAALLQRQAAARSDTPAALPATAVPAVPPSDDPSHPANLAPDELLQEKTAAWHQLVQDLPDGQPSPVQLPQTSRDAHNFIKDSVKRYANMKADGQPQFRVAQDGSGYRWNLHHGGEQVATSSQLYASRDEALAAARHARGIARHARFN